MKLTEEKIRKAIEDLEIDNFEIMSIERNEKGWWDVNVKTFYGCWLSELNRLGSILETDEIIISPISLLTCDPLGFNICIFDE